MTIEPGVEPPTEPGESGPDSGVEPPTESGIRASAVPPAGRPVVERLGMALIALVLAGLFAVVAVAGFVGGEPFLGVMGGIGCAMTLWVGALTVIRG